MFSIFTALFGGLYYGIKTLNSKTSTAEAIKANKNTKVVQNEFINAYAATFETEEEIKEYISCGKHYQEICDLLKPDLIYSLGEGWEQHVDIPNGASASCDFSSHSTTSFWIYHLLLAHNSKMSRYKISTGYMVNHIAVHSTDIGKNEIIRLRNIRFLECIEKRLIENNVPVRLVEDDDGFITVKPDIFASNGRRLW